MLCELHARKKIKSVGSKDRAETDGRTDEHDRSHYFHRSINTPQRRCQLEHCLKSLTLTTTVHRDNRNRLRNRGFPQIRPYPSVYENFGTVTTLLKSDSILGTHVVQRVARHVASLNALKTFFERRLWSFADAGVSRRHHLVSVSEWELATRTPHSGDAASHRRAAEMGSERATEVEWHTPESDDE